MKKQILTAILAVILMLSGCAGSSENETATGAATKSAGADKEQGPGGYVQETVALPEGETQVRAMASLDDGRIRFVGNTAVYESAEVGADWEEYEHDSEHLREALMTEAQQEEAGIQISLYNICMHSNGSIFCEYSKGPWINPEDIEHDENGAAIEPEGGASDWENVYVMVDPDGSEHILNIEIETSELQDPVFTQNGDIMGLVIDETEQSLYLIDPETMEVKQTIATSYIETYISYKNQVILKTLDGIETYDLDTGKLVENMPVADIYFAEENDKEYLLIPDEEQDLIYVYASGEGIYRFAEEGAVAELVVDSSGNSLDNSNVMVDEILLLTEESFLALVSRGIDEIEFLYYSYSENRPETVAEFTVYSLVKDWYAENLVAEFNEKSSQYKAVYKYGMEEGEMTISDALKKLSTEVLAGEGPDVFVMDDIPVDVYIEKEVLADLSDVIAASEAELFTNVISTYKEGEAVYAVPTSFATQIITGPQEYLEQVNDLASLAAFVETARKGTDGDDLENVIGEYWDTDLASQALQISGNTLLREDGTISEENLKQFLTSVQKIYEYNRTDYTLDFEVADEDLGVVTYEIFPMQEMKIGDAMLHMDGQNLLLAGNLTGMETLQTLFMIANELDFDYKIFDGMDQNIYMPLQVLAVNSQTEYMEAAKEFIAFSLSTEVQVQSSWMEGFPVSITAYDQLYERAVKGPVDYTESELAELSEEVVYDREQDDGSLKTYMFQAYYGTVEDYEDIKELLASLDTAMMGDGIVIDAILSETNKCLMGEVSVDEAAENIMRKINIYLAE